MKGRIRSVEEVGGEVLFDRECHVGSGASSDFPVDTGNTGDFELKIFWDPKHSSWFLHYIAGSLDVAVGEAPVSPGDSRPVFSPTHLQIGAAGYLFDATPDAPTVAGIKAGPTGEIPLKSLTKLEIGRGDREVESGWKRMVLDKEIRKISSVHAVLEKRDSMWYLTNRGSNDTILNGQSFDSSKLVFGDRFRIGPYLFAYFVDHLKRLDHQNLGSIQARGLKRIVEKVEEDSGRKKKIAILDNVDLDIDSGEFVAIIGGSGQGKSTLMNALCGVAPPTKGKVWINELEISDRSAVMNAGVGFVPQDDIVHRELRVRDAITISANLKLNLPTQEVESLVDRTLAMLDLTEHQTKRIRKLSGGQRKRVSIATEMLSSPSVLFLDEPTSGLDPATEWELMTALQKLAEAGTTVVCTTHMLENAHICNRFVIVQEGRVIFDGPPGSARDYFLGGGESSGSTTARASSSGSVGSGKLASYSKIFKEIKGAGKTGLQWEDAFRKSRYRREFKPVARKRKSGKPARRDRVRKVGFGRMISLLNRRQWKIVSADRLNLLFLFAQAFLIGFLIGWVAEGVVLRGFLAVVATMWFGCSNGAQQIVNELSIFRRERVSGQGINAYIFSKFGFLSFLTIIQAVLLFLTIYCSAFAFHNSDPGAFMKFPEMADGKDEKFQELLRSRLYPVPTAGTELAEEISMGLLITAGGDSDGNAVPKTAVVAGPGLVESVSMPGLILGVESEALWRPGKTVEFMTGETLKLPDSLPDYPVNGFEAVDVAPGMARSPFLKVGGWKVFSDREREQLWVPGETVICSISQQPFTLPDTLPSWQTDTIRYHFTYRFLRFFMLEDALLDSNNVIENASRSNGESRGAGASGELKLGSVVMSVLGLKVIALLLISVVGVAIGLTISALVQNSTQAVLWVPLVLIPQILFGGFVVKIPEMTPSVRMASLFFPSYAAQRVMDVSHIFGRIVPKMSNKTKMPVFTEGDGEKVEWMQMDFDSGEKEKKSEKFQKEVRENASWQNLLVIPSRMGEHKKEGDFMPVFDADGSFKTSIRQEPDTVDSRRDIHALYYQGIRYVRIRDAQMGMLILVLWILVCYSIILASLIRRQTGQ
ncbi:MAG: ATP-binding cassette domain-containing protein [Verrucomicrobiales bacterium]|nr:ATP-binding cassette domain-containing protein [Verrucomicrobiales bacterium]